MGRGRSHWRTPDNAPAPENRTPTKLPWHVLAVRDLGLSGLACLSCTNPTQSSINLAGELRAHSRTSGQRCVQCVPCVLVPCSLARPRGQAQSPSRRIPFHSCMRATRGRSAPAHHCARPCPRSRPPAPRLTTRTARGPADTDAHFAAPNALAAPRGRHRHTHNARAHTRSPRPNPAHTPHAGPATRPQCTTRGPAVHHPHSCTQHATSIPAGPRTKRRNPMQITMPRGAGYQRARPGRRPTKRTIPQPTPHAGPALSTRTARGPAHREAHHRSAERRARRPAGPRDQSTTQTKAKLAGRGAGEASTNTF